MLACFDSVSVSHSHHGLGCLIIHSDVGQLFCCTCDHVLTFCYRISWNALLRIKILTSIMLREYYEHMTHALMHIPDMGEEISSVASRMSTWLLWMHPMLLLAVDTSYMYMLVQISIGSRIYTIRLLWRSYSLALRLCVVYMNRIQQFPQPENNDYLSALLISTNCVVCRVVTTMFCSTLTLDLCHWWRQNLQRRR